MTDREAAADGQADIERAARCISVALDRYIGPMSVVAEKSPFHREARSAAQHVQTFLLDALRALGVDDPRATAVAEVSRNGGELHA